MILECVAQKAIEQDEEVIIEETILGTALYSAAPGDVVAVDAPLSVKPAIKDSTNRQ